MVRKYYAKAGIQGATVHTLRHMFCTHYAAAGTNLVVIQRAAGHASLPVLAEGQGRRRNAICLHLWCRHRCTWWTG